MSMEQVAPLPVNDDIQDLIKRLAKALEDSAYEAREEELAEDEDFDQAEDADPPGVKHDPATGQFASSAGGKTDYSAFTTGTSVTPAMKKARADAHAHKNFLLGLGHEGTKVTKKWDNLTVPNRGQAVNVTYTTHHGQPKGQAHDSALAFDRASVRRTDEDGRLHVAVTPISKSNVCPYLGSEIPDFEKLKLQADKVYHLFRDPDELKKAAPTFNNLPLLFEHVPVSADDHQPDLVIGSTGTDAEFDGTYLKNSLVVWAKDAIDEIESETKRELSSAYRYRADMTKGNYQGADYDGVMRDIIGNHVALVKEGRAGTDVIVGDSAETITAHKENNQMSKLSRKATLAQGALMVFLRPKMATDAQIDLTSILKDVTAQNYAASKSTIVAAVTKALNGKLAKDASIEDLPKIIDSLEAVAVAENVDSDTGAGAEGGLVKEGDDADPAEAVKALLAGKVDDETMAKVIALLGGGGAMDAEETDEEKASRMKKMAGDKEENPFFKKKDDEKAEDEEKEDMVPKKAMDAAIKSAIKVAADTATKTQKDIREAENFVRPWVGNIAMAHDSADGVFRTALGALGVKDIDSLPGAALKHVLAAQPKPSDKKTSEQPLAMDAAAVDSFNKRFPGAARIGTL